MAYDLNKLARLKALSNLATRVQERLNALETADAPIKSTSLENNTLKFFTTTDTSTTAAFSINLPEEIFLDTLNTSFEDNFSFSSDTYVGATDPNLNGKPVMVLGVKTKSNDGQTVTTDYSFLDMSKLVDTYTASDTSIVINGYQLKANVSADSDNMLANTANGLYVDGSGKVDKVAGTVGNVVGFASAGAFSNTGIVSGNILTKIDTATGNNFVSFSSDTGTIKDSGFSVASDEEISEMLDSILGSDTSISNITARVSSTSNFFSTDATTFHTFLQTAYDDAIEENDNETTDTVFQIMLNDGTNSSIIEITYGDIATILADSNSNVQSFVNLLTTKIQNNASEVTLTASFDSGTQSLVFANNTTSANATVSVDLEPTDGTLGNVILKSLYDNAGDQAGFTVDEDAYSLEISS